MFRRVLKYLASFSPIPLSKNEYYDRLTEKIIKQVCKPDSVCVDVGANNGKILSMFIRHSSAVHYAFEPIENLYYLLVRKYGSAARIYKLALSDKKSVSDFAFIADDPAYSSLNVRNDQHFKKIETIKVNTDTLDQVIPKNIKVHIIKLDVEGGEYNVLLGAQNIIKRCKPYILFEFGKGGAEAFGITSDKMFSLLTNFGYDVNLLSGFLTGKVASTEQNFKSVYEKGKEYFFIATPPLLA